MEIHIGSLIKARAKALRIGPTELGHKIETSKQNVYGIFRRQSIDTELLYRISLALGHDFFLEIGKQLPDFGPSSDEPLHVSEERDLRTRIEDLQGQNAILRRLNDLLEQQLAECKANAAG